jgi:hypothetical protein
MHRLAVAVGDFHTAKPLPDSVPGSRPRPPLRNHNRRSYFQASLDETEQPGNDS